MSLNSLLCHPTFTQTSGEQSRSRFSKNVVGAAQKAGVSVPGNVSPGMERTETEFVSQQHSNTTNGNNSSKN